MKLSDRGVRPHWIVPAKSAWIREAHGFSLQDNSLGGFCLAMIVLRQYYDIVMAIVPRTDSRSFLSYGRTPIQKSSVETKRESSKTDWSELFGKLALDFFMDWIQII